jgi:hypothetical protein
MTYKPFGNSKFDTLGPGDLARLVHIPEGWFIEYKREPCKPDRYAKEISAFANAHGGYLFIGLEEDPTTHLPSGGPGLPRGEVTRMADALRDSVSQHVSPTPLIELRAVVGPILELNIPEDRAVLVAHVPESKNTPHIHSSGKIYRRQVDAAEPKKVTDRAELDELYARHSKFVEVLDQELDLGFDNQWAADFATPWIHIAIVPEPTRPTKLMDLGIDRFRTMLGTTPDSIKLPDIYASAIGYVGRNARHQDVPDGPATTFECALGGAFFATIPLSTAPLSPHEQVSFCLNPVGEDFVSLLRARSFQHGKLLDGTYLSSTCWGLGCLMRRIAEESGIQGRAYARIHLRNIFRCIPFFDSKSYLDWCRAHTVPVIHRGSFQIPPFRKQWLVIDEFSSENPMIRPLVHILATLGVSDEIASSVTEESVHSSSRRTRISDDAISGLNWRLSRRNVLAAACRGSSDSRHLYGARLSRQLMPCCVIVGPQVSLLPLDRSS